MKGFDFDAVVQYRDKLTSTEKDFTAFISDFLLEMGLRALTKATKNTDATKDSLQNPTVRTRHLKGSWDLKEVKVDGINVSITIYNTADYAEYVEYGHRYRTKDGWGYTRPYYMLTRSIKDIEKEIPKRFNMQFTKFLKEHGL